MAHGRGLGLACEQERMRVGVSAGRDLVGEEAGEEGDDKATVYIPLAEEARDALVEAEHQLVEK